MPRRLCSISRLVGCIFMAHCCHFDSFYFNCPFFQNVRFSKSYKLRGTCFILTKGHRVLIKDKW